MALTKEDLQAIQEMLHTEIAASEQRMTERIDNTRTDIMSYIESKVERQIKLVGEGVQANRETLQRMQEQVDDIHEMVTAHEIYILRNAAAKGQKRAKTSPE